MSLSPAIVLGFWAFLSLSPAAHAQEAPGSPEEEPPTQCLLLENGDLYLAQVLDIDEDRLIVTFSAGGREVRTDIRRDRFLPHCIYQILRSRLHDPTPADFRELGEFAEENAMPFLARRNYERAIEADPSRKVVLLAREGRPGRGSQDLIMSPSIPGRDPPVPALIGGGAPGKAPLPSSRSFITRFCPGLGPGHTRFEGDGLP